MDGAAEARDHTEYVLDEDVVACDHNLLRCLIGLLIQLLCRLEAKAWLVAWSFLSFFTRGHHTLLIVVASVLGLRARSIRTLNALLGRIYWCYVRALRKQLARVLSVYTACFSGLLRESSLALERFLT